MSCSGQLKIPTKLFLSELERNWNDYLIYFLYQNRIFLFVRVQKFTKFLIFLESFIIFKIWNVDRGTGRAVWSLHLNRERQLGTSPLSST